MFNKHKFEHYRVIRCYCLLFTWQIYFYGI